VQLSFSQLSAYALHYLLLREHAKEAFAIVLHCMSFAVVQAVLGLEGLEEAQAC
jgi:hypothetical protein